MAELKAKPGRAQLMESENGTRYVKVGFDTRDYGTIYWKGFLTDKTWDRTIESMVSMGFRNDFNHLETLTKEVEIVVGEEEYKGKTTMRVQWVNGPRISVSSSTVDELNARLNGGGNSDADDIPF